MTHHGHALDPETEGEARDLLGVVHLAPEARVYRLEDRGVHHAGAQDLEPAGLLADPAAFPAADHAPEVGLDRGLGVGEERRPEAHGEAGPEDGACRKASIVPFRWPRWMPGPTTSPSICWNIGRVRDVVVAPVDPAGADDPHPRRVRVLEHVADLGGRGVGAQHQTLAPGEVERVLHVPRRMVRGHVEGLEAVVVVLDLATLVDLVAHGHEDVLEVLAHHGQGVKPPHPGRRGPAGRGRPARERGGRARRAFREGRGPRSDRRLELVLERVQVAARPACATLREGRPSILQEGRDRPGLAAEEAVAHRLEGRRVCGRFQLRP